MSASNDGSKVESAVEAVRAGWDETPRLVGVRVKLGPDQTGDPSVFVTGVLDESTRDEDWTSARLDPLIERFRKAVADAGVDRWVYVSFARPSELNGNGLCA